MQQSSSSSTPSSSLSSSGPVLIKSDSDPLPLPRRHGLLRTNNEELELEEDEEDFKYQIEIEEGADGKLEIRPKKKNNKNKKKKTSEIKKAKLRRVSFPADENLITGYVEPPNPWEKAVGVTTPEVITAYVNACGRYNSTPLNKVIQKLQMIQSFELRVDCLDLKGEKLNSSHMEALEEVFKRVRFNTINLENTFLDDDSSLPLFDMMEYYDSAKVLNISGNTNISMLGWQACCRMIKRTHSLEELIACRVPLEEEYIRILQRTLKVNPNLTILRLDNCGISGRHLTTLLSGLKINKVLEELHLAENKMCSVDGIQVAQLLRSNLQLKLLNLSGNHLEDQGITHLAEGLGDQNQLHVLLKTNITRRGLRSLLLRNTKMSPNAIGPLAKALMENKSLELLDLGGNNINNAGVYNLREALMRNKTLLQLKLTGCRIGCEGAVALAEYMAESSKIQELDLRDNLIQLGGLLALVQSLKVNQSVTQLKLDKHFVKESSSDAEQRKQIIIQVSEYTDRNWEILEKKREIESNEEGFDLAEDEEEIYSEPVSKLLSLWSHLPSVRTTPIHPPITVSSAAESPPEPISWQTVRGTSHYHHHHHHLRSPQPSPSSSPIPSPTRSRFHVTRVFQEVDSGLVSTSTTQIRTNPVSNLTLSTFPQTPTTRTTSRVKFIVTPVTDVKFEEPLPLNSSISDASTSSSPLAEEEPKADTGEESSDNDSVFLDQTDIAPFSPSSSLTLEEEEENEEEEPPKDDDDCNNNGDRDSGIYLLDLSNDDFYANSNGLTVVPNENSQHSTTNNELIDRLLQDSSSVPASEGIMGSLVDVQWNEELCKEQEKLLGDVSSSSGIDFLTGNELVGADNWVVSSTNLTNGGDLMTFNESLEPGDDVWLDTKTGNDDEQRLISNVSQDNCGSFDGGESNGSSDSGVTESLEGEITLLGDSSASIANSESVNGDSNVKTNLTSSSTSSGEDENENERETTLNQFKPKIQNGYRTISAYQVDEVREGKRTRTPGCAGSKENDTLWTE
ncbi:hypothetical protein CHUAL_002770 [Chamberlinius hualienensis]